MRLSQEHIYGRKYARNLNIREEVRNRESGRWCRIVSVSIAGSRVLVGLWPNYSLELDVTSTIRYRKNRNGYGQLNTRKSGGNNE